MKQPGNIVFLYTELAGYIHSCLEHLAHNGAQVHVMAWPVNAEAPFEFDTSICKARYHNRSEYSDHAIGAWLEALSPKVIVCSGWLDRAYLRSLRIWRKRALIVLALDNQIPATTKGHLGLLRARLQYKPLFHRTWVPGAPQRAYAEAMGFDPAQVFEGFYCADTGPFAEAYRRRSSGTMALRFLFVGRYVSTKGVEELWEAFRQFRQWQAAQGQELWELHCAGTGALYTVRPEMPGLKHHGFVQPSELDTFVAEGGVFVLPSHREPWGVVVQEMAAAGLPLLLSATVGAGSAFLDEGRNGYRFAPGSAAHLLDAMKRMAKTAPHLLTQMGQHSARLANWPSHNSWTETALRLLEQAQHINDPGTPGEQTKQPIP